jgi:hypothetical protein
MKIVVDVKIMSDAGVVAPQGDYHLEVENVTQKGVDVWVKDFKAFGELCEKKAKGQKIRIKQMRK